MLLYSFHPPEASEKPEMSLILSLYVLEQLEVRAVLSAKWQFVELYGEPKVSGIQKPALVRATET